MSERENMIIYNYKPLFRYLANSQYFAPFFRLILMYATLNILHSDKYILLDGLS